MEKEKVLNSIDLQLFGEGVQGDQGELEDEDVNDESQGENKPQENEPEKKYTDDDVDEIVKKKIAEERKKAEDAVKEAEKLAKMNADQKKDYEIERLKKEIEKHEAEKTQSAMVGIARGILAEDNIHLDDDLIGQLVTTEAESTKSNIDSFKKTFNEAVEKAVTDRLRGKTPTVEESKPTEPIRSLADMSYSDQLKLHESNPELFQSLLGK